MKKPSVTQLIGMLDKPALLRWANRQGLLGIDIEKERRKWLDDGTSIHAQIERREFIVPEHAANYARFIEDKEVISAEKWIETEWFIGRYDCKLRWRGSDWLVDWKSGAGIYLESKLQLVAYGMAEPADNFAVVNVPEFVLNDAKIGENRRKFEDIMISLAKIHKLRWEIENA
jgi:hypothetical protein